MNNQNDSNIKRRTFLASVGSTIILPAILSKVKANISNEINIAIIGAGTQGRILIRDTLNIPGIRFKAVCDIWEYSKRYAERKLKEQGHDVNVYEDYRQMLSKENDLDAVIVATPDWMHAEHAIACLKAGNHVYCEKEMSNNLKNAKEIVKASEVTGKFLQIGHQRRSSPVYKQVLKMLDFDKICGRLTNCFGQWNRSVQPKLKWPKRYAIKEDVLKKYGYKNMDQFRNWRWYQKYSAGPIADLGSHQIDIFSWFLHTEPETVMATGGKDYYGDRDWYSDVMVIYEYQTVKGSVRAFYQVLNTNGYGNYFERFHGDGGTITISENPKMSYYMNEPGNPLPAWMENVPKVDRDGYKAVSLIDAISRKDSDGKRAIQEFQKKNAHQFHLENFFEAIRKNDKSILSCPEDTGYHTAVSVLNVIPAIQRGEKMVISEDISAIKMKKNFLDSFFNNVKKYLEQ